MSSRRWAIFGLGLAASIAATALLWWAGFPGAALFLLFPFFWLPKGAATTSAPVRVCKLCGFESTDPEVKFCPRDGQELQ